MATGETMANDIETLWGIHIPVGVGTRPIDEGFVSIGWDRMGDISALPANREAFKRKLAAEYPDERPGAVPVKAGVLYRFAHEMKPGDGVIYPSKADRMVNLGVIDGPLEYHPDSPIEEMISRRPVRWVRSVPRSQFSQGALHEIGSALTLFQVANNAEEFLAAFAGHLPETAPLDEEAAEAVSEQVAENSDDYVLKRLKSAIDAYEFEQFTASLLQAMGYHARVTQKSGDAGVDVIAHRDELGFEPPIIKVQCKQTFGTIGRPDIQRLDGAIQHGEFGLFVTLGTFSADARTYESMKPNLRLIDGTELAALVYRHYGAFTPAMQRIVPLRRIYVPGPLGAE